MEGLTPWHNRYNMVQRSERGEKQVWTRIDKILADSRILDRITEIEIAHTNVSYHDAIVWSIETEIKRKRAPYEKYS